MRVAVLLFVSFLFLGCCCGQMYTVLERDLVVPRSAPAVATTDNKIFVAGGETRGNVHLTHVFFFLHSHLTFFVSGGSGTDKVEIWDIATNKFLPSITLAKARKNVIGLSYSNKV